MRFFAHLCISMHIMYSAMLWCSSSSPSSSILMQPLIIPSPPSSLPPSLPLSLGLSAPRSFPPSYNDLAITGAAVPALVSQGVWGLIGTEWVWVCVAVRPHWHRLGSSSWLVHPPFRDVSCENLYIQTHTHKHTTHSLFKSIPRIHLLRT